MNVTCPTCSRPGQLDSIKDWPYFPFCSHKCKMIDLGRWFNEEYTVPSEERPQDEREAQAPGEEEDSDQEP